MTGEHNQQHNLWKQEAEQLKKDLQSRPKEIKKNKVPIRFGKQKKSTPSSIPPKKADPYSDAHLRHQLGLD